MKIAIIGGGSVRTPLLVNGLSRSDLPVTEIALFDVDQERLRIIETLARTYVPTVRACSDPTDCMSGAAFVVVSIRAGGITARARDEAAAVAQGVVGQETVGAAGFAMAMRNAPHAAAYARLAMRVAPRAWIVNFTNPVGIVTQAMNAAGSERTIGICDTPTELFERAAHALDLDASHCFFDYFGLNHLGWLREVYAHGVPQLARLWNQPERLRLVYPTRLFDAARLCELRLLPTEYLFFYYSGAAAIDNLRSAGETRGDAIARLNQQLFRDLAGASPSEARRVYERYLAARSASYMQVESGSEPPDTRSAKASAERTTATGYDRIALDVIEAIHFNRNAVIPLNVANRGSIPTLAADDVVEVPCVVNANGARALNVGPIPEAARMLVSHVKEYERLTLRAAETAAPADAVVALASNPLVGSPELAASLVRALQPW